MIKKPQPEETSSQHHERADEARTASLNRLRRGTPSPPPVSEEVLHKRSDTSSTVITQILAPQSLPDATEEAEEEAEEEEWHFANGWTDHRSSQTIEPRRVEPPQDETSSNYVSCGTMTERSPVVRLEKQDPRASYSSHTRSNTQARLSSDTAIYTPEAFATPPQTADGPPPNEASTLSGFQRPPSPPLTPDGLTLSYSSSLDPALPFSTVKTACPTSVSGAIEQREYTRPNPRPATAISSDPVHNQSHTSRQQTSTGASASNHSPTAPRISTSHRPNFSINSGHAPTFSSLSSIQTIEGTFTTENDMPAELFFDSSPRTSAEIDDLDLPAVLASKIDYNIMPWEDAKYRNALPSALRRAPSQSTSLRSSFDSAAPPPISLGRLQPPAPRQSKPVSKLSPSQPHQTYQTVQQPQPSKPHKSFPKSISSLFHPRTPSPLLSVAYHNTTPGTPPLEISVSRTSIPSIPALFPKYKGPWPPTEDPVVEKGTKTRLQSRRMSVKAQTGGGGEVPRDPAVHATVQGGLPPTTNTSISQHKAPMPEAPNPAPQLHPLTNESLIPQIPLSAQQSSQIAKLLLTTNPTVPAIGDEVVPKRQSWLNNKAPYRVGELEEMILGGGVGSGGRGRDIAPGLM